MIFQDWQKRVEEITELSGHGSRKKIAGLMGLTSETIKNSERAGVASPKMVKSLHQLIDDRRELVFPKLHADGGRWHVSEVEGGYYVTHVVQALPITVYFYRQDGNENGDELGVKVAVYSDIDGPQITSLVDEARGQLPDG